MQINSYFARGLCGIAAVFVPGTSSMARADSVMVDVSSGSSYGRSYFNDYGSAFGGVYRPITALQLNQVTDSVSGGGALATSTYNLAGDGFAVSIGLSRTGAQS